MLEGALSDASNGQGMLGMSMGVLHGERIWENQGLKSLVDWAFLLLTGIYILCQCIYNSTYVLPAYTFPDRNWFLFLFYLCVIVVLARTLLSGEWKKRLPAAGIIAVICFLSYRTGRELFLLMIPVLTVGAMGMDYRRVLKVYVIAVGSFLAVTVLCAFTGVILNIVHYRDGHLRSSWGIAYETDFASLVLFFVLILWIAWEKVPDVVIIAAALLSFVISYVIAESRTSELSSLFLLFFVLLYLTSGWMRQKKTIARESESILAKAFHLLLIISFIVFTIVFFAALAAFARGGEIGLRLDGILSNRLVQTLEVYQDQGLHPFGCNYSPVGRGGSAVQPDIIYFIDSSYPLILIRYGWVLFVAVAGLWTWMGLRADRAGQTKLLYGMTVVAFHALSEHHFLDVQYNFLLILPFAVLTCAEKKEKARDQSGGTSGHFPEIFTTLVVLACICCAASPGLNRLRTVFYIWGTSPVERKLWDIGWIVLISLSISGLLLGSWMLASRMKYHERHTGKMILLPVFCIVVLAGMVAVDSHVIRSAEESLAETIETEQEILKTMIASANGRVYVENEPELYRRQFPEIGRAIWYGDDLARLTNASVVVSNVEDRQRFTDMGFLFTQISSGHGVYSNDSSVIYALEEEGYQWTDYDAIERIIDLQKMAELNGYKLSDTGSILLQEGDALRAGPYLDLYQGEYEVDFCLKAVSGQVEPERPVCVLRICDFYGENVYAEENIDGSTFQNGAECRRTLRFSTMSSRSMRFQIIPSENMELEVTGICYRKTGSLF